MQELQLILRDGQSIGEFGEFHIEVMATMILGAISEYMLTSPVTKKVDLEPYTNELIGLILLVVKK